MFTKRFALYPQFRFCSGRKFPLMGISMLAENMDRVTNSQRLQTHETKIKVNHVVKYKEIASKGSRKYKKVRGGAFANQEMGPWWSINRSIIFPEINFKCSQKQPKTKICCQVQGNCI